MRRNDRGADPGNDFVRTIEIKNKDGQVVERKEVVSCKGLVHLAHNERLSEIRTRVIQSPSKENGDTAIVLVGVVTARGSFSGLGDANPRNVNVRIAPHFIRMAETRALARALRAALDVAAIAIEELEDEFSFADAKHDAPRTNGAPEHDRRPGEPIPTRPREERPPAEGTQPRPSPRESNGGGYDRNAGGPDALMSDAQKRMLYRVAFEQGHEGDDARAWLHAEFEVDSLAKVSRRRASAFIDHYKSSGTNGHAGAS